MFMYSTIDRMTSGMISAGGITSIRKKKKHKTNIISKRRHKICQVTCNKYFRFRSVISRHCRRSPSWPNDALIVGRAKADVRDLTVSDATPVKVVSKTMCGGEFDVIDSVYFEQTNFESKRNDIIY